MSSRALLAAMALLAAAPAAAPAASFDTGLGRDPAVVAEPDGTAYVTWNRQNTGADGLDDVVSVCRVLPGAQTCDRRRDIVEQQAGSLQSTLVRLAGGALALVVQRSFQGSTSGTYVRISNDGGLTWGASTRVATGQQGGIRGATSFGGGGLAVLGAYEGVGAQVSALEGVPTTTSALGLLPTNSLNAHLGAVDVGTLLVTQREPSRGGKLRWRRFAGAGDPNVTDSWGPVREQSGVVHAADLGANGIAAPVVAGFEGDDLVTRRYDAGADAFGAAAPVRTVGDGIQPFVDLDHGGGVHLLYSTGVASSRSRAGREFSYLASRDGVTWPGTPQVLAEPGVSPSVVASAAGTAGVGVVVFESPNGTADGSFARIRVATLGGPASFAPEPVEPPRQPRVVVPPAPLTALAAPFTAWWTTAAVAGTAACSRSATPAA